MAKILMAEDEAHITRLLSLWLGRHGHQVLEAADGVVALSVLDRERVDLIICDMNMPMLDGAGLVRAVRDERGLNIPIMMVTARCDHTKLIKEMKPYNVTFHPKPFVPSRLVADIDLLLSASVGHADLHTSGGL
ncbi:MAG: response regulator [Planctomycetota bacterium]|jgi:DNA-binding response OmpR family regulator